jgi:hypothetical protein
MSSIKWNAPPHNPKARITDGPWGRYLVKRSAPHARWFIATLNGKNTAYGGDTLEQAMASIESVIRANYQGYQ